MERLSEPVRAAIPPRGRRCLMPVTSRPQRARRARADRPRPRGAGNNDGELRRALPEARLVELAGVRIALVHDSGRREGAPRAFNDASDSTASWCSATAIGARSTSAHDGQLLFNPGSPAPSAGAQPFATYGEAELQPGDPQALDRPRLETARRRAPTPVGDRRLTES